MRIITMGSLFDGIGGFPLAAIHNGIVPLWASEIEPFPIRVTMERLPGMLHYGDITKLHGALLPPVDIICGGSPCQDLSVAGKRTGLSGERSGLFSFVHSASFALIFSLYLSIALPRCLGYALFASREAERSIHHGGKEKPLRAYPAVPAPAASGRAGAARTDTVRLHHRHTQRTF